MAEPTAGAHPQARGGPGRTRQPGPAPDDRFADGLSRPPVGALVVASATGIVVMALGVTALVTTVDRGWLLAVAIGVLIITTGYHAARSARLERDGRRLRTELSIGDEERRRVLAAMVGVFESDRHRVASELQVHAVEPLTTLGTLFEATSTTLPADTRPEVRASMARIGDDLVGQLALLRHLTVALESPSLDHGGLAAAIRAYASEVYGDRSGTLVVVELDPDLVLDRSTQTVAYRIAQAALDNASQHAMAPSVRVRIIAVEDAIVVEIEDDGIGCDLASVLHGAGGASMTMFAELGRGTVEMTSTPQRGTIVRARLGVSH